MLNRPLEQCSSNKRGSNNAPSLLKLALILFLILPLACSPAVKITHQPSAPQKPPWLTTLPLSADTLYFVGIKSGADNLEDGQTSALKNAMAKISNHLGSKIESSFSEYTTEIEHELFQQITTKSNATIHGATIEDVYYTKTTRQEKNFRLERYDVYLLVSLNKRQAKKEMARQKKEKEQKVQTAFDFYQQGIKNEQQKQYYQARRTYRQALEAIAGIEEIITLDNKGIPNSEKLKLSLQSQLQKVKDRLAQITIDLTVDGPPHADQTFLANFTSALTQKGFTTTEQNPAIKITGQIFTKKSTPLRNRYSFYNYVYYAQGSVSAIRTSDNQKIATYSFQVKGFHRMKEQAALNALAEAGIEAGEGLGGMVFEKEKNNGL